MMPNLPKIMDGYVRVSQEGNRGDGLISREVQEDKINELAEENHAKIGETVRETRSGGKTEGPELERLIKRIESGDSAGLIVYKLTRLSRKGLAGALQLLERIHDAGGTVIAGDHTIENTPQGKMMLHLMLSIANFERERIAEDIGAAVQKRREQGIYTAPPPPGYEKRRTDEHPDGKRQPLVPIEGVEPVVEEVFRRYAEGVSISKISQYTAAEGHPISMSQIRAMVHNEAYLGKVPGPKNEDGEKAWVVPKEKHLRHQALVSQELWDRCQEPRGPDPGKTTRTDGLVRGLITCACCGTKLAVNDTKSWRGKQNVRSYACQGRTRESGCQAAAYGQVHLVDTYIRAAITQAADKGKLATTMFAAKKRRKAQKSVDVIKRDLKNLQTTETRRSYDNHEVWLEEVDTVKSELGKAQLYLREIAKQGEELWPEDGWEGWPLERQQRLANQYIEEVTLRRTEKGEGGYGRYATPIQNRITITWAEQDKPDTDIAKEVEANPKLNGALGGSPTKFQWYRDWQLLLSLGPDVTYEDFAKAADIPIPDAKRRLNNLVFSRGAAPRATMKGGSHMPLKKYTAIP